MQYVPPALILHCKGEENWLELPPREVWDMACCRRQIYEALRFGIPAWGVDFVSCICDSWLTRLRDDLTPDQFKEAERLGMTGGSEAVEDAGLGTRMPSILIHVESKHGGYLLSQPYREAKNGTLKAWGRARGHLFLAGDDLGGIPSFFYLPVEADKARKPQ